MPGHIPMLAVVGTASGVRCHNSIEFDDRDQMPHISRFLYGSWPSSNVTIPAVTDSEFTFGVEYRDSRGALHHRRVCLKREIWK